MIYFDSDREKIELAKHIASIETENRMLKEQLDSRNEKLPSRNEISIINIDGEKIRIYDDEIQVLYNTMMRLDIAFEKLSAFIDELDGLNGLKSLQIVNEASNIVAEKTGTNTPMRFDLMMRLFGSTLKRN